MEQTPFEACLERFLGDARMSMPLGVRTYGFELDAGVEAEKALHPARTPEERLLANLQGVSQSFFRYGAQPLFVRRTPIYKGLAFVYRIWPDGRTVPSVEAVDAIVRERALGENGYEMLEVLYDPGFDRRSGTGPARKSAAATFFDKDAPIFAIGLRIDAQNRIHAETDTYDHTSDPEVFDELLRADPLAKAVAQELGGLEGLQALKAAHGEDYVYKGFGPLAEPLNSLRMLDGRTLDFEAAEEILVGLGQLKAAADGTSTSP